MNFHRGRWVEEPEINLIPMIDILLVIVIFLMVSSHVLQDHGLALQLPQGGQAAQIPLKPHEIDLQQDGTLLVDGVVLTHAGLSQRLRSWGGSGGATVVGADARVSHGQVMALLSVLQQAGYRHIVMRTVAGH